MSRFNTVVLKYIFLLYILLLLHAQLLGQSLSGNTGLLRIPTANIQEDKTIIIGGSFLNKNLLAYSNYQYDAITGFATLTFLPFLELGIRYTRQINRGPNGYENYFADRMPSFKLRLFHEKNKWPAIAIGSTDFITSIKDNGPQFFVSYFAVMTKTLQHKNLGIELTVGHAFKIGNVRHYDMMGFFGGIRIYHPKHHWFSAMIDYDSIYWNMGFRLFLFNHLQIMPVLRNGKTFEGNISYRIRL